MPFVDKVEDLVVDRADIPADFRIQPEEHREYLIDGEFRQWDGAMQEVRSPIFVREPDGRLERQLIGSIPVLTTDCGLQALDAARRAYDFGRGEWPTMSVDERIARVEEFTRLMLERRADVVRLMVWEIGKSREAAEQEFDRTIVYIRNTIDALKELDRDSSRFIVEDNILAQVRRSPLGVVLSMGPFNYPLNETFATLIPALIMGNTTIIKMPKIGKMLFFPLLEAFRTAFPKGVANMLCGSREVIQPILATGDLNVLAFIGTSKAADALRKLHPKPHRLRCILGLEAKNAAIVMEDADLDQAVCEVARGAFAFNGQRCTAIKILYVAEKVRERFLAGLAAKVQALKLGMPWQPGVQITPLPEPGKPEYLHELVTDALAKGASIVNPGGGVFSRTAYQPTILFEASDSMRIFHEEQFGPVLPVVSFTDLSEPLQYLVESNYGQQISLFGKDPAKLASLIDPLVNLVSRVNINSQCQRGPDTLPFTGRKDSAEGTLSVHDALRSFSIRALVAANDVDANKAVLKGILKGGKSKFLSTDFIF